MSSSCQKQTKKDLKPSSVSSIQENLGDPSDQELKDTLKVLGSYHNNALEFLYSKIKQEDLFYEIDSVNPYKDIGTFNSYMYSFHHQEYPNQDIDSSKLVDYYNNVTPPDYPFNPNKSITTNLDIKMSDTLVKVLDSLKKLCLNETDTAAYREKSYKLMNNNLKKLSDVDEKGGLITVVYISNYSKRYWTENFGNGKT